MKNILFGDHGSVIPATLVASAIISFLAITGIYLIPITTNNTEADMFLSPDTKTLAIGEEFSVTVEVKSQVPVNAFTGTIIFNNQALEVSEISYNTSVADLWTEEPWYKNGDGTIGFAGGTTRPGGFTGTDTLVKILFKAIGSGEGNIQIKDARILEHDGLGTDADIAPLTPTFFTISSTSEIRTVIEKILR